MDSFTITTLQKRIFLRAALVTIGTSILNSVGNWLSLYSVIWWYDMPMHFFGGLFIGLLSISFLIRSQSFIRYSPVVASTIVLGIVFILGFVWEGYEIVFDIVAGRNQIVLDSVSDIFFDLAGGIEALFIYFRHKRIISGKILA